MSEIGLLQEYGRSSPLVLVRLKAQSVLMCSQGLDFPGIAVVTGRSPHTIKEWMTGWNTTRMASIFTGHQDNNNAGKLTPAQREQIKETLASPPSEYGLPRQFWDVPALKQYVKAEFGVVYESDTSYHYLLKFCGLVFKYPDVFDQKRDDVLIVERMTAVKAEVTGLLTDRKWEVFACDEVKIQQEAIIRRAWLKRGARTVVKVDRSKNTQSYIGFLNQRTGDCHLEELEWQNSDEVLAALTRFLALYPDKNICLVWDNAPFHRSKAIRDQLAQGQLLERVHLIALPPYAPDCNPIEHVWNTAKQAATNIQHDTFTDTKHAFTTYISTRKFNYLIQ